MIAACILTRNEEFFIKDCLQSVSPYVDEIIVIDNGSTDATVEIAKRNGCKVYEIRNNNLDAIRNNFYKYTDEPWILSLDADERLPKKYINIRDKISNLEEDVFGLIIPRIDFVGNGKWAYNKLLRLYRNDYRIKYSDVKVHSSLKKSIYDNGGKIDQLSNINIFHIDMLRNTIRSNEKRELYKRELEQQIKMDIGDEERYSYLCFLGLEYLYEGRSFDAIKMYDEAIQLDIKKRTTAYIFKAQLLFSQGKYDESLDICDYITTEVLAESDQARYLKTRLMEKMGKNDELIKLISDYVIKYPEESHNYLNLAYLLYLKKEKYESMLKKANKMNEFLSHNYIYKSEIKSIFSHQIVNLDYSNEFIEYILKNNQEKQLSVY